MQYVQLGGSGLRVSRLCLGTMSFGDPAWREWVLGEDAAETFFRKAADVGITFFDTADVYSRGASEVVVGRLLRKTFSRREDYVVATKVAGAMGEGPNDRGLSRGHIFDAIDASLRRLGMDHVDLYQIHRWDPDTPIEETMEALHDLVRAGKVRYLGASKMWTWQFAKAQHAADLGGWTRFVSMQNHYNLLYREEEREMNPFLLDQGVACLPWSPLARGRLARAGRPGEADTARSRSDPLGKQLYRSAQEPVLRRLAEVASDRGVPPTQIALAWLLHQHVVTAPIVGATKPQHLDDQVAAVALELSESHLERLSEPYRPQPVAGHS